MNIKRSARAMALLIGSVSIASAGIFFAQGTHLTMEGGRRMPVTASGGWPSHRSIDEDPVPSLIHRKHIGKPQYGDIKCAVEVGDLDDDMTAWFNKVVSGTTDRKSGSIILTDRRDTRKFTYHECWPVRYSFPGFDSVESECDPWEFSLRPSWTEGGPLRMKAKEKANRTKCANNLRMTFSNNGKPVRFELLETESVETVITEVDVDEDGEFDSLDCQVGNVVIFLSATQAKFFGDWMTRAQTNPYFKENKMEGAMVARTRSRGEVGAVYQGMQPISVAIMGDGSVRVEFVVAQAQLTAKPRN